jgi:hypothetical protein
LLIKQDFNDSRVEIQQTLTHMKRQWIFYVIKTAFLITAGFFLFGWVVMTLWNNLIPTLFNGPVISFGQALGLFVLARVLLLGFRPWGGGQRGFGRYYGRKRWEKRLSSMTPDEREKFRNAYAKRCGKWYQETETNADVTENEQTEQKPQVQKEPQEVV